MESTHLKQPVQPIISLLKFTFGLVPIVAGLDKFTDLLTHWEQYLHPAISSMIPAHTFMMIVGVIEIIAGIIVLIKTEIGGYIVSAWLALIALSLLANFSYVDVAVRDLVMSIAAFSMARLVKMTK